jgi:hypothetical protein
MRENFYGFAFHFYDFTEMDAKKQWRAPSCPGSYQFNGRQHTAHRCTDTILAV